MELETKTLRLEDILEIRRATAHNNGYEIVFPDNRLIWIRKKRTVPALLILIRYGSGSEADLAGQNDRLQTIKNVLAGKMPDNFIKDRYGDANKPFSELWTEEGFSCVTAENMDGNRQYVLRPQDHELLFNDNAKSVRINLSEEEKNQIMARQEHRCNICGAVIRTGKLPRYTFAKDRVKAEFDHRVPVEKGGTNELENIQCLCHYCNKSKRQMCFICNQEKCSGYCALVSPETSSIVLATGEDISDRITKLH